MVHSFSASVMLPILRQIRIIPTRQESGNAHDPHHNAGVTVGFGIWNGGFDRFEKAGRGSFDDFFGYTFLQKKITQNESDFHPIRLCVSASGLLTRVI